MSDTAALSELWDTLERLFPDPANRPQIHCHDPAVWAAGFPCPAVSLDGLPCTEYVAANPSDALSDSLAKEGETANE